MANTVIAIKKSATPSAVPAALANGELAINYADGKLFYKAANGTITAITGSGSTPSYGTVSANGTLLVAGAVNDVLTISPGQNIFITGDAINDKVTINADLTAANTWANTKLANTTGTLAGALTTTGSLTANGYVIINPSDGIQEGGEIQLIPVGNYCNWILDSYQNNYRTFSRSGAPGSISNVIYFHANGGIIRMGVNRQDPLYTLDVGGPVNASAIYVNGSPIGAGSMDYAYVNTATGSANSWANTKLTNVAAGGPINVTWASGSGYINATINISTSGVTATTYGGATQIPYFTVDSYGRITSASNVAVQGMDYAYANAVGAASNTWANTLTTTDRAIANAAANSANAYTITVGAASNTWANTLVSAANSNTQASVSAVNSYVSIYIANTALGANTFAGTVANNANSYAGYMANSANIWLMAWSNNDISNIAQTSGRTVVTFSKTNNLINATIDLAVSGVTATTYGGTGQIPAVTVDAYGRITSASNVSIQAMDYAYANAIGAASNTWANSLSTIDRAMANTAANSANAYAVTVGASSNTYANNTFVKLTATTQTITGDLAITGNLTLLGNATTIQSNNLVVGDSMIYLAANNYSGTDLVDIGFIANYGNTTGANVHTGLLRDATTKQYYLFQGLDIELQANNQAFTPGANGAVNATLNADIIAGNITVSGANVYSWIVNTAIGANTFAGIVANNANSNTQASVAAVNSYASIYIANTALGANSYAGVLANNSNSFAGIVANNANANAQTGHASANAYAGFMANSANILAGYMANSANIWLMAWSNNDISNIAQTNGRTVVTFNKTNNLINATIDLAVSGVTATIYGGTTQIPAISVDAYGRITSASNVAFTSGSSVNVGNTVPAAPSVGNLWWDTDSGRMFVYYSDANSSQWVDTSPASSTIGYFKGNNGTRGNPTTGPGDIFRVHANTLYANIYFDTGYNALAAGPISVAANAIMQINAGAVVTIV